MKPKKDLQRTVTFWQLVRALDREPLEQIDWPSVLGELVTKGPTIRHNVEGVELSGTVHTLSEADHLVLTKDRDDLPRQQHMVTGQVADMSTTGTEWVVIESAFVSFLEFGNVFGFLQSRVNLLHPGVYGPAPSNDDVSHGVHAGPAPDTARSRPRLVNGDDLVELWSDYRPAERIGGDGDRRMG